MNATFNFAHTVIAGLDNAIADVSCNIAALEKQLADLREQQKQLENERQGLLTLAKAGESALEQAATFLALAKAGGREDMIQAFWNGIDGLRNEKPKLPPVAETTPPVESTESTPPVNPDTDSAIDVPATEVEAPATETATVEATEVNEATASDKPEWHSLNWREFLAYAKSKGIATKGRKRGEIEADLLDLTNTDKSE